MKSCPAILLLISLTALLLSKTVTMAADPAKSGLPYKMLLPTKLDGLTTLPSPLSVTKPSILLPAPSGELMSITRSKSFRRAANPDVDLTTDNRRWQSITSSSGQQPYSWGLSEGNVDARLSLGLLSTLFYTDNVNFTTNDSKKTETIFEISPILKLDIGDPSGAIGGAESNQSEYYTSLLYLPTFYYHLKDDVDDYAQHFLGEVGRVNELSRSVLRLNYDERILASSENTMPEANYTLLEASALTDHRVTQRTTLRGKVAYRTISVAQAATSRAEWVGDFSMLWELSPKTKLGLGTELARIIYEQRMLGSQNYQQALIFLEWKPSSKIGFTTRTGMEWRHFDRQPPRSLMTSLVTLTTFYWQAAEKTRLNLRFRVSNQPSVVAQGALYREVRFGPDLIHEFGIHYYTTLECQVIRRRYDSGRLDWEPTSRIALGYRDDSDKANNRLNIELYVQWHRRERSDLLNATLERTQAGIQVTRYF